MGEIVSSDRGRVAGRFSRFGVKPYMRGHVVLVTGLLVAGCSNGLNTNCEWPDESTRALGIASDALLRDVELAEELSIRFGDERWPPGPARQQGRDEQCLAPLLQHVADAHGLPLPAVLAARSRIGDRGLNLAVNVPVGLAVTLLAVFMLWRIERRFAVADEPLAVTGAISVCSLVIAGVTVATGRLWEAVFETIRIGNGHLSYRGLRLPWTQHSIEFAAMATAVFIVVSIGFFSTRWPNMRGISHVFDVE